MKSTILFALLVIFGAAFVESQTAPPFCNAKPDGGLPCVPVQKLIRYFYNPLTGRCSPFIYTG